MTLPSTERLQRVKLILEVLVMLVLLPLMLVSVFRDPRTSVRHAALL